MFSGSKRRLQQYLNVDWKFSNFFEAFFSATCCLVKNFTTYYKKNIE